MNTKECIEYVSPLYKCWEEARHRVEQCSTVESVLGEVMKNTLLHMYGVREVIRDIFSSFDKAEILHHYRPGEETIELMLAGKLAKYKISTELRCVHVSENEIEIYRSRGELPRSMLFCTAHIRILTTDGYLPAFSIDKGIHMDEFFVEIQKQLLMEMNKFTNRNFFLPVSDANVKIVHHLFDEAFFDICFVARDGSCGGFIEDGEYFTEGDEFEPLEAHFKCRDLREILKQNFEICTSEIESTVFGLMIGGLSVLNISVCVGNIGFIPENNQLGLSYYFYEFFYQKGLEFDEQRSVQNIVCS